MKDYRLSEVKECCKHMCAKFPKPCKDCEMQAICKDTLPLGWDIEPRDMIELPCKEHRVNAYGDVWDVYYRDYECYGKIDNKIFFTEANADEFIAQLKEIEQ